MDDKTIYWASIVLSIVALLLLIVNMSIMNGNRQLQQEINQRQESINKAPTLGQINNNIVEGLAEIAVKNGDIEARGLLAAQGITIAPVANGESPKTTKK